jgi:spore coat protein A, manganese oxidase
LKLDRRAFSRLGMLSAAGLILPLEMDAGSAVSRQQAAPAPGAVPASPDSAAKAAAAAAQPGMDKAITLKPYVDPLPIPPRMAAWGAAGGVNKPVSIRMGVFQQKVHRDLPPTTLWGYNSSWPGPTIEIRRDRPLHVAWANRLPRRHFLPLDYTVHGEEETVPAVRAVVHVHGAQTLPEFDGYPDAWTTADGRTGSAYKAAVSYFPNPQPAATLWYHDHAIGITRLNIYAGLAGFYLIRDEQEESLNLPSGAYEIPLMVQDRLFSPDGSLLYPAAEGGTHPVWIQEFFGNTVCVNGKAKPYLEVEPRRYRFRMVNASNARFYHLTLRASDAAGNALEKGADAPLFQQIGADAGLLPAPMERRALLISPGERIDFVLDFTGMKGASFAMNNDAPAPYARGGQVAAEEVMLFKVSKPLAGADTSAVPAALAPFEPLDPMQAVRDRFLTINEMDRAADGYTMMGMLDGKHWNDPVTEDPQAGSMEIWSMANTTGDVHPMHLHLVRFQVLNRQPFDVRRFLATGKVQFTARPIPPESNERPAWKDTVKTYPGFITRIIQRFDLPPGTSPVPGQRYRYVWHCHILEHEDNEMMRPYDVVG